MILKLQGTRENEEIHLVSVRKPEGDIKPGEVAYRKDPSSPVTSYRKKMTSDIKDFQLNRVEVRHGEYEGKPTKSYSLFITYKTHTHLVDLGGGMVAKNVVNSLISLKDKTLEENTKSDLSISFYQKKDGYGDATIKKASHSVLGRTFPNGKAIDPTTLSWYISFDDQQAFIDKAPDPFKKDVILKNYDRLDAYIEELVAELNTKLPASTYSGGNALDDAEDSLSTQQSTAQATNGQSDIPFGDEPSSDEVEV